MALITDTAFVKDAKGWKFAEDSRISKAQEKDIVVSPPLHSQEERADPSPVKHICCSINVSELRLALWVSSGKDSFMVVAIVIGQVVK